MGPEGCQPRAQACHLLKGLVGKVPTCQLGDALMAVLQRGADACAEVSDHSHVGGQPVHLILHLSEIILHLADGVWERKGPKMEKEVTRAVPSSAEPRSNTHGSLWEACEGLGRGMLGEGRSFRVAVSAHTPSGCPSTGVLGRGC